MVVKSIKCIENRTYINCKSLTHLVWNHYNPDNPWKKGYVIHHKDRDTLNDHISNLELMTVGEHIKLHWTGKHHSEKSKFKMSSAKKGNICTEEHKEKLSKLYKGENNPFYGKHHNEETKKKISDFAKTRIGELNPFYNKHLIGKDSPRWGKRHSEESKKKMSEAAKGRIGIKNPFYGKKHSEETKKKMSDIRKRRVSL